MAKGKKTGGRNWKPGQSGNLSGRPKKENSLTEILRDQGKIKDVYDASGKNIPRKEAIATKLWGMAIGGNLQAMQYIYDRIDGKSIQSHMIDLDEKFGDLITSKDLQDATGD